MWRSFFLAVGITFIIVGAECMIVERAALAAPVASASNRSGAEVQPRGDIVPPDWASWSLLSAGSVVILYSFTIPRRVAT